VGGTPDKDGIYGSDHFALLGRLLIPCLKEESNYFTEEEVPKKIGGVETFETIIADDETSTRTQVISYILTLVLGSTVSIAGVLYAKKHYAEVLSLLTSPTNMDTTGRVVEVE
jgi:hypothetical protein